MADLVVLIPCALHLSATEKITLGSATVPEVPPNET